MKLNNLEFPFDIATVLAAAQKKFDFHTKRTAYWSGLYEIAEELPVHLVI